MNNYYKLVLVIVTTFLIGMILMPFILDSPEHIKSLLTHFKQFCHNHPSASYLLYGTTFAAILFLGLPFATAAMLLAGITYKFWEAALLIAICRILVAIIVFAIARSLFYVPKNPEKPRIVKKFEKHPAIGLLLMRMAPLPDNAVNYAMGTSSIKGTNYVLISLLTMIPSALIWVSVGNALGSINELVKYFS